MSDSDSGWEPTAIATRADDGRPARSLLDFDPEKHAVFLDSDDEHASDEASGNQSAAADSTRRAGDGRGRYDRSSSGKREAWKPHVQRHVEAVNSGNLSSFLGTQCASDCPQGGKCVELLGTMTVLKHCAAESFGVAALLHDWDNITKNHAACRQWFQLAYAGRITDVTGAVQSVTYKVGGQLVCAPAWAAMRGIKASTAEAIHRAVRNGQHDWTDSTKRTFDAARRHQRSNLTTAAMVWWTTCAARPPPAARARARTCAFRVGIGLNPAHLLVVSGGSATTRPSQRTLPFSTRVASCGNQSTPMNLFLRCAGWPSHGRNQSLVLMGRTPAATAIRARTACVDRWPPGTTGEKLPCCLWPSSGWALAASRSPSRAVPNTQRTRNAPFARKAGWTLQRLFVAIWARTKSRDAKTILRRTSNGCIVNGQNWRESHR